MEADQIKKLYQAMAENGFSTLELELAEKNRVRLVLDAVHEEFPGDNVAAQLAALDETESPANTQVEIRSDKVGTFAFADRQLKKGDRIKKGEILGLVKGISFQDRIKCSLDGIIRRVEVENGSVVDYGRLLFLVDID
ncbi:MAG: hypothetical protein PHD82_01385 [Candidatus Riflebacteria bacterium]|nr:hypothetical protein [Candidatus Riflebacteria bacterium]